MTMTHDPTALDEAERLAALGWRVLPITPGKKHPPVQNWREAASSDLDQIRAWWSPGAPYHGHGVGVATGPGSGVWVLDVDVADGKPGRASLEALVGAHGNLPRTVAAVTGSGGRHIYFQWDPSRPVTNGCGTALKAAGYPGLDVRGDGGQVVAPPTVHPSGGSYRWWADRDPWAVEVFPAPDWLYELLFAVPEPAPAPIRLDGPPASGLGLDDDSIAAWLADRRDWHTELSRAGWSGPEWVGSDSRWTRPGKNPRDGHSAVLHEPDGPLVVFTTELAPGLERAGARTADGSGVSLSLFGFVAGVEHGGDRRAAAKAARAERNGIERPAASGPVGVDGRVEPVAVEGPVAVVDPALDWGSFWKKDHHSAEFAIEHIAPKGRATHIYAPRGEGKSDLTIYCAAMLATGQECLGVTSGPQRVGYVDFEMTDGDLFDRLVDMGIDESSDLSNLRYVLSPPWRGLDRGDAAAALMGWVEANALDVLFVDSITASIIGEENSNDVYDDLAAWTIYPLKTLGVTSVWLGNSGKDHERGSRGGSRKEDVFDCVWSLRRGDGGEVQMKNTKKRSSWVPDELPLVRSDDPYVRFRANLGLRMTAAGARECAEDLDALGVPADASIRGCQVALREAGKARRRKVIGDAQHFRRSRQDDIRLVDKSREPLGNHPLYPQAGNRSGTTPPENALTRSGTGREPRGTTSPGVPGNRYPPLGGNRYRPAHDEDF